MLKLTSFINITLAISYLVLYLMSSYSYAMVGIFLVLLSSILSIIVAEKQLRFSVIHYINGALSVIFAGFLSVWVFNVISSSIAYGYFGNSWLYILLTVTFIISIILHFLLMCFSKRNSLT